MLQIALHMCSKLNQFLFIYYYVIRLCDENNIYDMILPLYYRKKFCKYNLRTLVPDMPILLLYSTYSKKNSMSG
jgi:hypothetical protein